MQGSSSPPQPTARLEMVAKTKKCFTRVDMRGFWGTARASFAGCLMLIGGAMSCGGGDDGGAPDAEGQLTCLDPEVAPTERPELPLAYETEHIDIYLEEERFLCSGSAQEFNAHVEFTADLLGIELQRRIPLYLTDNRATWCPPGSGGCAMPDGVLFSGAMAVRHELVHGVACEARTEALAPSMAEGLSTALEPLANDSQADPEVFFDLPRSEFQHYGPSGHFVRWLLERFGGPSFMEVYRVAMLSEDGEPGVWGLLREVYGAALAEDYASTAPARWSPYRECAGVPLLEPVQGQWHFEATFDCESSETFGPYDLVAHETATSERDAMYQSFLIEVDTPGAFRVQRPDFFVEPYTNVRMTRCVEESSNGAPVHSDWYQEVLWFTLDEHISEVELELPGVYRVDVLREYGPPQDVWLTIEAKD